MSEILTIGSRASFLAKIQTLIVIKELKKKFNKIQINTKYSTTKGDESKSQEPWKNLGYGIFTNTLTSDLKKNKFDCVVHSFKDLPVLKKQTSFFTIKRDDPRDVLLIKKKSLKKNKIIIGTSSPRRKASVKDLKDLIRKKNILTKSIRGNVTTRLTKVVNGKDFDAIFMAKAAIDRIFKYGNFVDKKETIKFKKLFNQFKPFILPLSIFPSAASQGTVAIECLSKNKKVKSILRKINCKETQCISNEERSLLKKYGGGCGLDIGITIENIKNNYFLFSKGIDAKNKKHFHINKILNSKTKEIDVWCSNDYLSMSQNTEVMSAMKNAVDQLGAGSGGTRNISGTTRFHVELEEKIAKLHGKERALAFNSGYSANDSALTSILSAIDNCLVLSDELNHASLIEGIRASKREKVIYKHNDPEHLKAVLKGIPFNRPKMIVLESVYSMEADFAPLKEIVEIAHEHGALIYLDEVHAVGLYGPNAAGLAEQEGVADQIDIINGTLAKAFGLAGGYIASSNSIIDFVRSFSKGFIFTTSMCPAVAAGTLKSVQTVQNQPEIRSRFFENVKLVKSELEKAGIPFLDSGSHIIPVIIGESKLCRKISDYLLEEHQVYVQPINFPTVPKGTERIRITPTPSHSKEDIKKFVNALTQAWVKFMPKHEQFISSNLQAKK